MASGHEVEMGPYRLNAIGGYEVLGRISGLSTYGVVYLMHHPKNPEKFPKYCVKISPCFRPASIAQTCSNLNNMLLEHATLAHVPELPCANDLSTDPKRTDSTMPCFHEATNSTGAKFFACSMGYAPNLQSAIEGNLDNINGTDTAKLCIEILDIHTAYSYITDADTGKGMYFSRANITSFGWFKGKVVFLDLEDFGWWNVNKRKYARKMRPRYTLFRQESEGRHNHRAYRPIHAEGQEAVYSMRKDDEFYRKYGELVSLTPIIATIVEVVCCRASTLSRAPAETWKDPYGVLARTCEKLKHIVDKILPANSFYKLDKVETERQRWNPVDEGGMRVSALMQCVLYLISMLVAPSSGADSDPFLDILFSDTTNRKLLASFLRKDFKKPLYNALQVPGDRTQWPTKVKDVWSRDSPPAHFRQLAADLSTKKKTINDPVLNIVFAGFTERCLPSKGV